MVKKVLAVLVLLGLCAGCTTAAKQAYYTAKGPQGACLLLEGGEDRPLAKYDAIEVARFDNDLSNVVGGEIVGLVQAEIVEELQEKVKFGQVKAVPKCEQGKVVAPTAVLRGRLIDITSDKIPGQKLIGGGNHLIAVVEIVDKASGKVLVKANLRGVVKSVAQRGNEPLAKGMARGAKKLCVKLGKEEKEEKKK